MALSNLNLQTAADEACISLGAGLAKILPFAHSLNKEAERKGTVIRVPKYAATAAEFADNNTYAQTTNVAGADLTLNLHPVAGFEASDVELLGSDVRFFQDGGKAAGQAVAKYLVQKFMQQVLATDTNNTTVASSKAGLTGLYATAVAKDIDPANAVLVLNGTYYAAMLQYIGDAAIIGTDAMQTGIFKGGALGFADVVCYNSLATNVVGFIAEKGAMAFGARAIKAPLSGVYSDVGEAMDPNTGAPISLLSFGVPETGSYHITATCVAGVAKLDASHIVPLKAAG